MNNYKENKEKGIGSYALLLGILPTLLTATYNEMSVLKIIMDTFKITYSPYMAAAGLLLSVPGLILGLSHSRHWGAKAGAVLCAFNAVGTVIALIMTFVG